MVRDVHERGAEGSTPIELHPSQSLEAVMHLAHLGDGRWGGEGGASKTSRMVADKAGKVTELSPATMSFGGGSASHAFTFTCSILEGSDMLVFVFQKEKARC